MILLERDKMFARIFTFLICFIMAVGSAFGGTYRNDGATQKTYIDATTGVQKLAAPGTTVESYQQLSDIDSEWTKISDDPYYPLLLDDEIVNMDYEDQYVPVTINLEASKVRVTNLTLVGDGPRWEASHVYHKDEVVINPDVEGVYYQAINLYTGVDTWAAGTAYVLDDKCKAVNVNGFIYEVTAVIGTGVSGATEPVWPTTIGATVADESTAGVDGVTWTCQYYAGTSGTVEPTWPTESADQVVDNFVTWTTMITVNDARLGVYPNSLSNPYHVILEPSTANNDRDVVEIEANKMLSTLYLYCGAPIGCKAKVEVMP